MKIFMIITLLIMSTYHTYNSAQFVLCIDGGGSKTALQVIDDRGNLLPLTKTGETTDTIKSTGSNINTIGYDGVKESLSTLFDDLTINNSQKAHDILATCYVIAGMAGVGAINNKNAVIKIFEELGVQKDRLLLTSDAALALQLVPGNGAILIAGTGSICLGKKDDQPYRSGGLGPLFGDEGSSYYIGRKALKAALAEEYGWGEQVSWTSALHELYNTPQLKSIFSTLRPSQIACATPILIDKAQEQDAKAVAIITKAAAHLCTLVTTVIKLADLNDAQVHLWGGLFKSSKKDTFIETIEQDPLIQQHRITLINQASQNAATLFAQQHISKASESGADSWQAAQKLFAS